MALLSTITSAAVRKPCKPSVIIAYQREYYDTRIREDFEREWSTSVANWQEAVKSGCTDGLEEPVKVKLRTQVARTAWDRESQEFRDTFSQSVVDQHSLTLGSFERKNEVPETPEDYAK